MVLPCLASFLGPNDCGEFTRGQTYRLPPVALQGCDLAEPFGFGFGFGLEKLPASIKRTKIEIIGVGWLWRYSRTLSVGRFMVANCRICG